MIEEQKDELKEEQIEELKADQTEDQAEDQVEDQEDQEDQEEQQTEDQWEELTDIGLEMLQELNHDFKDGSIEQFPYSVTMIAIRRGVADNSRKILRNSDILEHYFDNAIDRLEAGNVGNFFNPDDVVTVGVDDDSVSETDHGDVQDPDFIEEPDRTDQTIEQPEQLNDDDQPDQPDQATPDVLDVNDFHRAVEAAEARLDGGTLTEEQLESVTTLISQLNRIVSPTEAPTETDLKADALPITESFLLSIANDGCLDRYNGEWPNTVIADKTIRDRIDQWANGLGLKEKYCARDIIRELERKWEFTRGKTAKGGARGHRFPSLKSLRCQLEKEFSLDGYFVKNGVDV